MRTIKHLGLILCIVLTDIAVEINIDSYFPSVPHIAQSFGVSIGAVQIGYATFQIACALGVFIFGLLSIRFEKRKLVLLALLILIVSLGVISLVNHIYLFYLLRFVSGFAVGAIISVTSVILTEVFTGRDLAKVGSILMMILAVVPAAAPFLGGVIETTTGLWQLNFIIPMLVCILVLFLVHWKLSDYPAEKDKQDSQSIFKTYIAPLSDRAIWFMVCNILGFGWILFYMTISPELYQVKFGLSAYDYGNLSLGMIVVFFLAPLLNIVLIKYMDLKNIIFLGIVIMFVCTVVGIIFQLNSLWSVYIISVIFLFGLSLVRSNIYAVSSEYYLRKENMASVYLLLVILISPIFSYYGAYYQISQIVDIYHVALYFAIALLVTFIVNLWWVNSRQIKSDSKTLRKITINMAPADLPKEGGRFDLPIALGILAASSQCGVEILKQYEFAGELALGGELRAIRGVLPFALATYKAGNQLVIPAANAEDVSLVKDLTAYKASTLFEVIQHLEAIQSLRKIKPQAQMPYYDQGLDLSDVKGQYQARRALEISASGRHNMLFMGPPGTGKTMLANRLNTILPPLTESEALESASIHSIHGAYKVAKRFFIRPFRAPHHSASAAALVGGGSQPKPGEISLAHYGVLFLDEFPEYDRSVLEVLREPLESGKITISRANRNAEFPAKFQLIAAMNPCPCGYLGSQVRNCSCTEHQVKRYQSKLSGPLLDRIDLHVEVPDLPKGLLSDQKATYENSQSIRSRVNDTYHLQINRQGCTNNQLTGSKIDYFCHLNKDEVKLLDQAMERLNLSARAYHRILKVSRTIADIEKSKDIQIPHITEALSYRKLDRYIQ